MAVWVCVYERMCLLVSQFVCLLSSALSSLSFLSLSPLFFFTLTITPLAALLTADDRRRHAHLYREKKKPRWITTLTSIPTARPSHTAQQFQTTSAMLGRVDQEKQKEKKEALSNVRKRKKNTIRSSKKKPNLVPFIFLKAHS